MKITHKVYCPVCHKKFDHESIKLSSPISKLIDGERRLVLTCNIKRLVHSPEAIQAAYKECCSELIG